ncbi:MAG TPA: hypothetical protein VHV77_02345 [Pirellulales bacterium]|nr:hypothetical protein [Pirellulales bacterium]
MFRTFVVFVTLTLGSLPSVPAAERSIDSMRRVDRSNPPSRDEASQRQFIYRTEPHPAFGEKYTIVTDFSDATHLDALDRLARHRGGVVIRVDDLGALAGNADERQKLTASLRGASPKFVAIAPRWSSYRENMLLAMWQVLAALDDDPQLDAFPGLLLAANDRQFEALIDRSIQYSPQVSSAVRPFLVAQLTRESPPTNGRSLEKVQLLRDLFEQKGIATSNLLVRQFQAEPQSLQPSRKSRQWEVAMSAPRRVVDELPSPALEALNDSTLLVMFGHGVPGMTCSIDVNLFDKVRMDNKIVLSGSCYSAAPLESDFAPDRVGIDGSEIRNDRPRFAFRAIAGGATVVYGHMHENGGFPEMYPVLDAWMNGLTVGEAYQRQLNALLAWNDVPLNALTLRSKEEQNPRASRRKNGLLYVIIGDPALVPLAPMPAE